MTKIYTAQVTHFLLHYSLLEIFVCMIPIRRSFILVANEYENILASQIYLF